MYSFSAKCGFLIFKKVVYKTTFLISVLINEDLANEMCDRDVEIHEDKFFKFTVFKVQKYYILPTENIYLILWISDETGVMHICLVL
jgi:hypothetical protein